MHKEGFYSSGEFAKKANVTVRTIRYYDKQNILKPSYVTDTGVRFYTDSDFTRLQQILLLKYLGFSLDDIKNMTIGDSDYNILKNSLHLQLKLIQDKIAQMELVKNAIEDTVETIDRNNSIDWSSMLSLIHLTNMESSLKTQYQNAGIYQQELICMRCILLISRDGLGGYMKRGIYQNIKKYWSLAAVMEDYGLIIYLMLLKLYILKKLL